MLHQVRVPASSANLGPGFDALGMALGIHLTCRFRAAERLEIHGFGRDASLIAPGENNLIWQTALNVAKTAGRDFPPIYLEVHNEIPIGKGLDQARRR